MFFSRKIAASELLRNLTDCHSHILPGVDDGVQSVVESLQILDYYELMGVQRVVFTPHVMEDLHKNSAEFLRAEFAKFKKQYSGRVELSLGAEYMLDGGFTGYLKSGDLLPLYDYYLLVEMSCVAATVNVVSVISEIMSLGYFVVLAHPERYLYLGDSEYQKLKNMGVLFQLNLPSILGSYGKGVKLRAEQLLNRSMYNMVGSDIHSFEYHHRLFSTSKISKKIYAQIEKIKANNICAE